MDILLVLTTLPDRAYAGLAAAIRAAHPYELPEIVALPVSRGLPDYLAWVAAETQVSPAPGAAGATKA